MERRNGRLARVVAVTGLALVAVRKRRRFATTARAIPLDTRTQALVRELARRFGLVLRDVSLRGDTLACDGLHLEVGDGLRGRMGRLFLSVDLDDRRLPPINAICMCLRGVVRVRVDARHSVRATVLPV